MAHGELSTMTELFAFPLWFPLLCMQTRMGHGNSNHQTNKQTKVEDNQKEINFLLLFLFLNELKETIIYLLNWPPLRKTQEKKKKKKKPMISSTMKFSLSIFLHCIAGQIKIYSYFFSLNLRKFSQVKSWQKQTISLSRNRITCNLLLFTSGKLQEQTHPILLFLHSTPPKLGSFNFHLNINQKTQKRKGKKGKGKHLCH